MQYISTNSKAITVAEMINILKLQDESAEIYIVDDNLNKRPVLDIGLENNNIVICDY